MTVGLLGVASVFPVGGWYMQRAEISDRGSAIAQSVMSDLVARGMLNPSAWFTMIPNASNPATNSPNYYFTGIDGKYTNSTPPPFGTGATTFTRPFAETLSMGLKLNSDPVILTKQFGSAYVIDPLFAAAAANTVQNTFHAAAYAFPASAYQTYPWPSSTYYGNAAWNPWRAKAAGGTGDKTWPIRRVTFQQPNGKPLEMALADNLARVGDDLATDLPATRRPSSKPVVGCRR